MTKNVQIACLKKGALEFEVLEHLSAQSPLGSDSEGEQLGTCASVIRLRRVFRFVVIVNDF